MVTVWSSSGLAQGLDDVAAKFGQLVEEEYAVMGERHLTWTRVRTAADETRVRNGVVRGAEGPGGDEGLAYGQDAGDRMDLGGGERLLQGGWREDRGQAAGGAWSCPSPAARP